MHIYLSCEFNHLHFYEIVAINDNDSGLDFIAEGENFEMAKRYSPKT